MLQLLSKILPLSYPKSRQKCFPNIPPGAKLWFLTLLNGFCRSVCVLLKQRTARKVAVVRVSHIKEFQSFELCHSPQKNKAPGGFLVFNGETRVKSPVLDYGGEIFFWRRSFC